MSRPTVAIINRQALRDNLALADALAPTSKSMPMVKANAYGHGAVEVCKTLSCAPAFGVACVEEALALRDAGIQQPLLLLEGTFSADEVNVAAENNFWLMVENEAQKEAILSASTKKSGDYLVGYRYWHASPRFSARGYRTTLSRSSSVKQGCRNDCSSNPFCLRG